MLWTRLPQTRTRPRAVGLRPMSLVGELGDSPASAVYSAVVVDIPCEHEDRRQPLAR